MDGYSLRRTFSNSCFRGILLIACLVAVFAATASAHRVAILTSDDLTSTRRTVSGARSVIKASHEEDIEFLKFSLSTNSSTLSVQVDSVRRFHPDVILTVGSAATDLATKEFKSTPTVFAAVLYPSLSGFVNSLMHPGANVTGASLNLPVETQFRYFKTILPNLRRVGVLYTDNTAPLVDQARAIAAEVGIQLEAISVNDERSLPKALDSLRKTIQGVWSLADPTLFSPQATKYILLNLLRDGIPVMGFSRHVVESGALFGLDFDYKAVGRQAGEIVVEVLSGTPPGRIPVSRPDIIWFHYNEKTAQYLHITLPPELVAVAKEVYR